MWGGGRANPADLFRRPAAFVGRPAGNFTRRVKLHLPESLFWSNTWGRGTARDVGNDQSFMCSTAHVGLVRLYTSFCPVL